MVYAAQEPAPVELDEAWTPPAPAAPSRGRVALVAAIAGAVLIAGAALTYRAPPAPIPSLFGMQAATAADLLRDRGYDVALSPAWACEPRGLVLGSDPGVGTVAPEGGRVTVRYAVPADVFCMPAYQGRVRAWEFVRFAAGGPPPTFADEVAVQTDDQAFTLTAGAAADPASWRGSLDPVRDAGTVFAPTSSGMPRLSVQGPAGPLPTTAVGARSVDTCAAAAPAGTTGRSPLRLRIEAVDRPAPEECPLTVDLYRDADGRVDAVAITARRAQ